MRHLNQRQRPRPDVESAENRASEPVPVNETPTVPVDGRAENSAADPAGEGQDDPALPAAVETPLAAVSSESGTAPTRGERRRARRSAAATADTSTADPGPLSLGEAFPQQQQRCRELLAQYSQFLDTPGVNVRPAMAIIEDVLRRADQAMASGDVVEMIRLHEEMSELE